MIYLFHNIYGDCDHLIATKPAEVTAIPFGWDTETETARNVLLAELNQSVPSLPCLLIEFEDGWRTVTFVASENDSWELLLAEPDPVPPSD